MKELPVYQYKQIIGYVKLDDEDALFFENRKIFVNDKGYPIFNLTKNKIHKTIRVHRHVLGLVVGDGKIVDHIDHDLFNSQKSNLRIVSPQQNIQHQKRAINNTSGHRGVYYRSDRQKWAAQTEIYGKKIFFGNFNTLEEAALAVELGRKSLKYLSKEQVSDEEARTAAAQLEAMLKSHTQNTSGYRWISYSHSQQRWDVRFKYNKKQLCLGTFKTLEEAITALISKRKELGLDLGQYANRN